MIAHHIMHLRVQTTEGDAPRTAAKAPAKVRDAKKKDLFEQYRQDGEDDAIGPEGGNILNDSGLNYYPMRTSMHCLIILIN